MKKILYALFLKILICLSFNSNAQEDFSATALSAVKDINAGSITITYKTIDNARGGTGDNQYHIRHSERISIKKPSEPNSSYIQIYDGGAFTSAGTSSYGMIDLIPSAHQFPVGPTTKTESASIRFTSLPIKYLDGDVQIKIESLIDFYHYVGFVDFRHQQHSCCNPATIFTPIDKIINLSAIGAATNITASFDQNCSGVQLNWSHGAGMGHFKAPYQILRKLANTNNAWTVVDETTYASYLDASAAPNVEYEYSLRSGLRYTANNALFTVYSTGTVRGRKLGLTDNPKGLYLDQANCNGHINVNWNYAGGTNPPQFEIKKATDANFTQNVTTEVVSGSDRSWRDVNASSGTVYYYAVQGKAGCPNQPGTSTYSSLSNTENQVGNGVPPAPTVSTLTTNSTTKSVTLNWSDNSALEHSYKVVRVSGTGSTEFPVAQNAITYTDNSALACENYTYQVKAVNDQCAVSGVLSTNSKVAYIPANVTSTFGGNDKIDASDGEFGDRIELKWRTPNRQNDNWTITRIDPIALDTTQIASTPNNTKFFSDNTANANTLYKYIVQGELDCAGNLLQSNTSEDIGFRLAYGTVNGQITYAGGVAVKGVKVTATAASGASGRSGDFNGTSAYATVPNNAMLNTAEASVFAYVRPHSNTGIKAIVDKTDGANGYLLYIEGAQLKGKVGTEVKSVNIPNFSLNNWISVAMTVSADSLKLFAGGNLIGGFSHSHASGALLNDGVQIGRDGTAAYFDGEMDEVRIFDRALSNQEVKRSFDVYINPSMNGLVGYWRFDEGFGNKAYDYSKTLLTTNKNHANLTNVVWSNVKPSTSQLTAGAYSDSLGSYFIPFIPYLGSGDNFTITPEFGTHSFTPATTTLLIGSGSANYTGQNFLDNSSFSVSGTVKYKGTSCFVKDTRLKIDGEVVIRNGNVVLTDGQGRFDIQVPIGPHVVEVEQASHVYSAGTFPSSGAHDFQQNVTGIEFIDSTLVKIVGRVAGGGIQKSLPPALGRGKNNIGQATIIFDPTNGCLVDPNSAQGLPTDEIHITTDVLTGEYTAMLPPLTYSVPTISPINNSGVLIANNPQLTLSTVPPVQTYIDTVYKDSSGRKRIDRIDSVKYQKQSDFIYNAAPKIGVQGKINPQFFGADSLIFDNSGVDVEIPISSLPSNALSHPVFYENEEYTWLISAFEIYENKDGANTVLDSVPMVDGEIDIINNLAGNLRTKFDYGLTDSVKFNGIQEYTFTTGQARTSTDPTPANNFTKTCQITLKPQAGSSVDWKINNELFRGIIFGARALGNSFSTSGPDVVTMILRDPPGTESFASWESGTTVTTISSWEHGGGVGLNLNKNVSLGTKFTVGLGYATPTEITNDLNFNTQIETSVNATGELVEEKTTSVNISTGGGDEFVGANADLFFGRAMNMDFGLSQVLTLIEANKCGSNSTCYGDTIFTNQGKFLIGITNSMFAIPQGYETEFVFTQGGIEKSVIPKLVAQRDQLLIADSRYTSFLSASHPNFGKSNDDLSLSSPTPDSEFNGFEDSLGTSYHFTGYTTIDTAFNDTTNYDTNPPEYTRKTFQVTLGVDSVWWYNKQIRLWEDALAQNEQAKVQSVVPQRNISYQGGSAISYSSSSNRTESNTTVVNFNFTENLTLKIGAKLGGVGGSIEQGASLFYNHASTFGRSDLTSTTFEYTISDPNVDDEFSVDVFQPSDGFGPIFKTRGGQTSCPYQGKVVTKYYLPGTVLDKATIQLEQPGISAVPSALFNVPANGQGNISLSLTNDGLEDAVYSFKILENTNPNGAIIKIDGIDPNRDFAVPAQTTINKTLVVEKGPNHIAYDSIGLIFHSTCQYAFGTAGYDDIADTVYISVNFLSSCTDIDVQIPQNQFIANNSYDNKLPIILSGYDINYGGLEKIQLQYKPSNQASWIPLETEWFKDTIGIDTLYPNHPDPKLIPRNQAYINYLLDMDQIIDQNYDLRATSTCKIPFNPKFTQESAVISGVVDRVNPHPFGSPTPADGVLDPNDDISIQFNETIEAGSLTPDNFQITGVVNGQELRHDKAVAFDGATGYLEIANGFDFASNDFTIEFWAKRDLLGTTQTVISQGVNTSNSFHIGFNSANNIEVNVGNQTYTSTFAILDDSTWHHYAVTYNKDNLELEITDRFSNSMQTSTNNSFFSSFQSGGKTYVGKNAVNNGSFFNGSIHQLRIWNKALNSGEVSSRINQHLHGREAGLIGYWPMDEGRGVIAEDKARFRNAEMKANWEINPKSTAVAFDGTKYAVVDSAGTLAITQEMDLSIEFWFKTNGGQLQSMLSNGGGMYTINDANRNGWNIEMSANNEIWVKNDSFAFKAVQTNFADNKWHHFALVVNRLANTTAYIDGNQQRTTSSVNFWGFGAAKLAVGSRYSINGTQETFDQFFNGNMDEVRIWNTALLRENIELNRYNRLQGDEFGLLAYYPFESYRLELGVPILDVSMANQSSVLRNPTRINSRASSGSVLNPESPAVALQRPVQKIKYSWSVNNDKIIITPNEEAANIENVTLNISVKDVKDLRGNVMQSPKTWIAFVNKNQVLWQDAERNLAKEFNDTMTFTSKVINSGGDVKNFTISNIPAWLTVSPSSGTINPLSARTITFTVNQAINIGDYAEDLLLTTDFGFNEKLLVKLKVRKTPPAFTFNRNQYAKSMNFIGQIAINGNISLNDEDKLVAYMSNEIRGVANLQYVPSLDQYIAFLDVYTNTPDSIYPTNPADSIYFKVWNASKGELHENVTPTTYFIENQLSGSLASPTIFNAVDNLAKPIVLERGWNWVSFPLADAKMKSLPTFLNGLNFNEGDVIKTVGNNSFAQYGGTALGWTGGLTRNGFTNNQSYMVYISNMDTLDYKGLAIDPDTMPINVAAGWNRIGFVSTKNMQINTALANYNATDGDLIKSQQGFAVYQNNLGWIGSLTAMEPTEGYLLKAANSNTFVYPRRGLFRLKANVEQEQLSTILPTGYSLNPNDFETSTSAIIKINTCEEVLTDSTWSLVAFKDNELRGYSKSTIKVDDVIGSEYFMTVYGSGNETYRFEMLNAVTKEKMKVIGQIAFEKDKLQGEVNNPLRFDLVKEINCDQFKKVEETIPTENLSGGVYPNPFSSFLTIVIPQEISENGTVQIFDQNGRLVFEQNALNNKKIFLNGAQLHNFSNGVYQLKFTDGETVITEKLVRIK